MTTNRFTLDGSNRVLIPGSVLEQQVNPEEPIDITIRLRSRSGDLRPKADALARLPLRDRNYLSREAFDQQFGADPRMLLLLLQSRSRMDSKLPCHLTVAALFRY